MQRARHPEEETTAVARGGPWLRNISSFPEGRRDPLRHGVLEARNRLFGRVATARAVGKLLRRCDPLPTVLLAVLDQGDVVRQFDVAIDCARGPCRAAFHLSIDCAASSQIPPERNGIGTAG